MVGNIATEKNESVKIELVIMIGSVGRYKYFIVITCVTLKFLKNKGQLLFYMNSQTFEFTDSRSIASN